MANNYDTDLIKRASARTTPQTRSLYSNDKIKTLTKLKIQEYIESFFSKIGENRDLLGIVSPRGVSFNIDRSFDPQTDPTERKLQIARYFNELRSVLPAILIMDGGIVPLQVNLGLISDSYNKDQDWYGHYPVVRQIPIIILAAARDVESADELSSILSLLFNELRNLAGGNYMQGKPEEGETWTVILPNEGVPSSSTTELEVPGDPVEKIHYTEQAFNAIYEDVIRVKQPLPTILPGPIRVNTTDLAGSLPPIIEAPATVGIADQIVIVVRNIEDHMRIVLSDAKIATLSYNMILTPRRYGKVKIQVVDYKRAPIKRIVAEKEIEIV